jgi:hypothetical protein
MVHGRNRFAAAILALMAVLLAIFFIGFRADPLTACPGTIDLICPRADVILPLDHDSVPAPAGSEEAKFGGRIPVQRVIFARHGGPWIAAFAGALLPLILLAVAVRLFLRREKGTRLPA